jgi:glycerol-3-phosphate dehydrogenase
MRISPGSEAKDFDAIIIGAGINGAGIARDAALRGLRVLLLDKGDIAGGTSGWSTRLIHGGLRYLEHGELGLVRESLRERELLLRHAPHLVRPLPMLIPIYTQASRGPLTIRAGMLAYDLLSFDKSLDHHRMLSPKETLRRAPGLSPVGLLGAALYYDAQVEYAERLVLENALDARDNGAIVQTYARVDQLILEQGSVRGVEFTDLLEGTGGHLARAPLTVNVAGPWVDQLIQAGLRNPARRFIGGTKGSHLVVREFPCAPLDALYVEASGDARPFFIIPWNDLYLIGTTDLRYEGNLDHIEADDEEIDYLLRETNRVIPSANLTRASILYTYSGVRPLPFTAGAKEKGITRRHFIHDHAPEVGGLLSIVGGKLTTYRHLSEQAVDLLFKKLDRKSPACVTAHKPLPGAATADFAAFREEFKNKSPLHARVNERLLRIYGTRAPLVLEIAMSGDDLLRESFSPSTGAIGAEILFAFYQEMARGLCDCLMRRTMVGIGPSMGLEDDERAAGIAQKYLGWSRNFAEREVAAYREYLRRFHPQLLTPRRADGFEPGAGLED